MELEELKATWQSVKPHITTTDCMKNTQESIYRKADVKSRLLRRLGFGVFFSFVCLILLASSHLWSPTKLSNLWLVAFCLIISLAIFCEIYLYKSIKRINLWKDTNAGILSAIVKIKKLYKNIELVTSILVILSLIWLSFIPPFNNLLDRTIIFGLTIICFSAEFLWYRSNLKQLNRLSNWDKE